MHNIMARLVLLSLLAFLAAACSRMESQAPTVTFNRDFKALGRSPSLSVNVEDSGSGLRHVTIHLKQKDQDVVLADEAFDKAGAAKAKDYDVGKLIVDKYKIQDGPASLTVNASDYALRNLLRGNQVEITKDFRFDVTPPQ